MRLVWSGKHDSVVGRTMENLKDRLSGAGDFKELLFMQPVDGLANNFSNKFTSNWGSS